LAFLLFAIYFLAGCYFIGKIKFVTDAGIERKTLLLLFTVKIFAGVAIGLVSEYLFSGKTDITSFNLLGKIETDNLFNKPYTFCTDIYKPYLDQYGTYFFLDKHFLNDLGPNIILKMLGFFNIITGGNYYVNSLFFNFISFIGIIALFRIFKNIYTGSHWSLIIGCFLLPSTLFFSSGIHKDLMILAALSFFFYALYFSFENGFSTKRKFVSLLSLLLILMIRNYVGIVLIICTIGYLLHKKLRLGFKKISLAFLLIVIICAAIFKDANNNSKLLQVFVNKQTEFISLGKAKTDYHYQILKPTIKSFINYFPSASRHAFVSPYPFEFGNSSINFFSLEIIGYFILIGCFFLYRKKSLKSSNSFVIFTIAFAIAMFLIIGFTITNAGSVVRYRSIYLPFLITPLLSNIDWAKIKMGMKKIKKLS
jgi:hypothetical protein